MAPHGVPLWTFNWTYDNGRTNVTIATGALQVDLTLQFTPVTNPLSNFLLFSNNPTSLQTTADTIVSNVTLTGLSSSYTGWRFWFFSTGIPPRPAFPLRVQYCPNIIGSRISFEALVNPCGFGCFGMYSCSRGYVAQFPGPILCMQNAMWNITKEACIFIADLPFDIIDTDIETYADGVGRTYSVGYTGLVLTVSVDQNTQSSCSWSYLYTGNFESYYSEQVIFNGGACGSLVVGVNETYSCAVSGSKIDSNLTMNHVFRFGKLNVAFFCDSTTHFNRTFHIVYCQSSQGSLTVEQSSLFCGFGCVGTYICPRGLMPVNLPAIAVCTKDAIWNVSSEDCIYNRLRSWQVIPTNSTTYAVGFQGMGIQVIIYGSESFSCSWLYNGEFNDFDFLAESGCQMVHIGNQDRISCVAEVRSFTVELIFGGILKHGPIDVLFQCNGDVLLRTRISVEYCVDLQNNALLVSERPECGYMCSATFICLSGFQPTNAIAYCSETAQWNITSSDCGSGQERLQSLIKPKQRKIIMVLFWLYLKIVLSKY